MTLNNTHSPINIVPKDTCAHVGHPSMQPSTLILFPMKVKGKTKKTAVCLNCRTAWVGREQYIAGQEAGDFS